MGRVIWRGGVGEAKGLVLVVVVLVVGLVVGLVVVVDGGGMRPALVNGSMVGWCL